MTHSKFMIGCDPEIFMTDALGGFVSAIDKIGGSKHHPRPLPELGDGFNVQEDNVAIEFGIPPANNAEEWVASVSRIRDYLQQQLELMGLGVSKVSAINFPEHELQDPRALEFGCDPDYNAWTGLVNPRPKATDATLRSAGGHIHVGHKFVSKDDAYLLVRYMDLFSIASVYMDDGVLRKSLYGKAGACRIKPYGVDYFWIFSDDKIRWAYDVTEQAMAAWQQKKIPIDDMQSEVVETINSNNVEYARHLVKYFNLPTL